MEDQNNVPETKCEECTKSRWDWIKKIGKFIISEKMAAILLSVMSIVVSVVGVKMQKTDTEMAAIELEMLLNDREAYFVVENKEAIKQEGTDLHTEYIIKNAGGRISGAHIYTDNYIHVAVRVNDDRGRYEFGEVYEIPLDNASYLTTESYETYNHETNSFSVIEVDSIEKYDFLSNVTDTINSIIETGSSAATIKNEVKIIYSNYQNISKNVTYYLSGDSLEIKSFDSYDNAGMKVVRLNAPLSNFDAEEAKDLGTVICSAFLDSWKKHIDENKAQ